MNTLDELFEQLETFKIDTLLSIVLVNLGARPATLIEHAFGYLSNSEAYEIKHTKYPGPIKRFYKYAENFNKKIELMDQEDDETQLLWQEYIIKYQNLMLKYGKEIDRLFLQRVGEAIDLFYPKLHYAQVRQGILITRTPLKKSVIKHLQDFDDELIGEILGFPCYKNFMKPGHSRNYGIEASLNIKGIDFDKQIFGNTFCDPEHSEEFAKLAKKYEKALKSRRSVFKGLVKRVNVSSR
jgi:hypothetical protein